MPSKYVVVERPNPRDANAPKKFYAHAKSRGEITIQEIAAEIAKMSTVSTIDAIAVLEAFKQVIPQHLAEGKIVRLGNFGAFITPSTVSCNLIL